MIEDRIGTIGSTHGVNARPRPSTINAGTMASRLPPRRIDVMPPSSDCVAADAGGAALTALAPPAAGGALSLDGTDDSAPGVAPDGVNADCAPAPGSRLI